MKRVLKGIKFSFQFVNLGEAKSTGTVDEAKDLISKEEPERFENDVEDEEEEGKFIIFKFIFCKQRYIYLRFCLSTFNNSNSIYD